MTKHSGFSSATLWHQDMRYWCFGRPELVSVWLALGAETRRNGALQVIPGSHRLELDRGLFLRPELVENRSLIECAVTLELVAGDVLLFSSRLFHAAGRNDTAAVKLSVVFTYHAADNQPIPGTRSAQYPSIAVPVRHRADRRRGAEAKRRAEGWTLRKPLLSRVAPATARRRRWRRHRWRR